MKILVTGGCGFIGSALIRWLLNETQVQVLNLDKLTYAGNENSLASIKESHRYQLAQVDICSRENVRNIFNQYKPDAVVHLAAESHVDRSIDDPAEFIQTNVIGTFELLEAARHYYASESSRIKDSFRFLHVSTDEVYGDLPDRTQLFHEESNIRPSSPYSASKAGSDHLVNAWHRTYGLPTLITNCSNNYGPYQFPEKLIPHMILSALAGEKMPVYGDGKQVRDWLYVDDHVRAIYKVLTQGELGHTYNVGGLNEQENIEIVHGICRLLEQSGVQKPAGVARYEELITFVKDRPGHDVRYAVDASKIQKDLGWAPKESFTSGLEKTITWYLENPQWWQQVLDGSYQLERRGAKESKHVTKASG